MLQRVRDLKVQYDERHARHRRQGRHRGRGQGAGDRDHRRSATQTEFNGISLLDGTGGAGTISFQVGANDGRDDHRRRPRDLAGASGTGAIDGVTRHRDVRQAVTLDRHRHGDQEHVDGACELRRGAEPPRAPPQQPRDLPGEPGGVREPDPRRGHGPEMVNFTKLGRSCSRPARACSRRPTRPRRAFSRSCASPAAHLRDRIDGRPSGRPFALREIAQVPAGGR